MGHIAWNLPAVVAHREHDVQERGHTVEQHGEAAVNGALHERKRSAAEERCAGLGPLISCQELASSLACWLLQRNEFRFHAAAGPCARVCLVSRHLTQLWTWVWLLQALRWLRPHGSSNPGCFFGFLILLCRKPTDATPIGERASFTPFVGGLHASGPICVDATGWPNRTHAVDPHAGGGIGIHPPESKCFYS